MNEDSAMKSFGGSDEHEFQTIEAKLDASRATIRSRLRANDTGHGNARDSGRNGPDQVSSGDRSSWSSLIFDLLAPTAKNTAQRHPWSLIAGSAAIGAYLAWARPWRGLVGPMVVGAVLRNLGTGSLMGRGGLIQHFLSRRHPRSPNVPNRPV